MQRFAISSPHPFPQSGTAAPAAARLRHPPASIGGPVMTLESLIHAQLEGEITPAEHAELEAQLREPTGRPANSTWSSRTSTPACCIIPRWHRPAASRKPFPASKNQPPHRAGSRLARYPWPSPRSSPSRAATVFFSKPTPRQETTATGVAILTPDSRRTVHGRVPFAERAPWHRVTAPRARPRPDRVLLRRQPA
jgi:hypothetical protein